MLSYEILAYEEVRTRDNLPECGVELKQYGMELDLIQKQNLENAFWALFGKLDIDRYVYAPGPKKKIAYTPIDARLGLPRGEYSYVLEDWLERLCVKEPFAEAASNLEAS